MSADAAAVVSAIAAAASAVLTLIAVVIAAATLIGARKDAQRATAQAETDRREDLLPYLTPELERELLSHGTLNLVIKNWGRTAARDVQVAFTPPPPTDLVSLPDSDMMTWLYEAYAKPITLWPPRWRMTNVYRAGQDETAPVSLKITYEGPDGHQYEDDFTLDPAPLLKTTASSPSDPSTSDPGARQEAWLKRIARGLEALTRTMR